MPVIPTDQMRRVHSLRRKAAFYCDQAQYEKAESLYHQALSLIETACGVERLEVTTILNNLAVVYKYMGRFTEAGQAHM